MLFGIPGEAPEGFPRNPFLESLDIPYGLPMEFPTGIEFLWISWGILRDFLGLPSWNPQGFPSCCFLRPGSARRPWHACATLSTGTLGIQKLEG